MNIQSKINKLLQVFRIKGYILKINTEQFLSEYESRMMTKYILYESHTKKGEVFYSKVKLLIYLAELYKRVGDSSG